MRQLVLTTVLFFMSIVTPVFGQVEGGKVEFSPTIGVAIPLGTLDDVVKVGFATGLQLSYYASPQFAFGGAVIYNSFKGDNPFFGATDIDLTGFEITGHFKIIFIKTSGPAPYVKVFAGAFPIEVSALRGGGQLNVTETDFGFGGAFGVQLKGSGNIGGFLEAAVINISTEVEATKYMNIRAGISFFVDGAQKP